MGSNPLHIINFSQIYKADEDLVGKKAYGLGMLWKLGVPLPKGFVLTTEFFKNFLRLTGIDEEIKNIQTLSHPAISDSIDKLYFPIQQRIMRTHIPEILAFELHKFYKELSGLFKERPLNVLSSSADNKSIAFTDIKGDANLILKIKTVWSMSLKKPVAIIVQENIKSEMTGRIISNNPDPDEKLTHSQTDKLKKYCRIIQRHFYFPYEIEFCLSKGEIFITKIIPFTGAINDSPKPTAKPKIMQKTIIKGVGVNPGIVTGSIRIFHDKYPNAEVRKGEIAILPNLDRSLFGKIKNAKAVVTDLSIANSLDKAFYRKNYHMPTIEGVKNATRIFKNGNIITVNGISGEIYSGGLIY